jgi:hypothetical protein
MTTIQQSLGGKLSIEKAYNIWADQYDSNKNKTRDLDTKSTTETLSEY